jgi:cAMP phosphodiesterase
MEVRILGCYGAELPGYRFCSFVISGKLQLNAGAVTSIPRLSEPRRISNILVTPIHLDPIKDIPFLAENLVGDRFHQPLNIISIPRVIEGIMAHLFNDALWPNFPALPTMKSPVLKFMSIQPREDIPMQDFTIRAIPVNHTVPAMEYRSQ